MRRAVLRSPLLRYASRDSLRCCSSVSITSQISDHCFEAVQRPMHPSDRTKEPEPVLPRSDRYWSNSNPRRSAGLRRTLGLTVPELNWPERLQPEITNRSVALPHGVPVAAAPRVPSKFLPPPAFSPPSADNACPRRRGNGMEADVACCPPRRNMTRSVLTCRRHVRMSTDCPPVSEAI